MVLTIKRLPPTDGDGYEILCDEQIFAGYLFKGFNEKWAVYSTYGSVMTDHIYDTPEAALKWIEETP